MTANANQISMDAAKFHQKWMTLNKQRKKENTNTCIFLHACSASSSGPIGSLERLLICH